MHLKACLFASLLCVVSPAFADTTVRMQFAYLEQVSSPLPEPVVQASDLLAQSTIATTTDPVAEDGSRTVVLTVPDAAFQGPYARLRVALNGLRLPPEDSKADQDISFAFELVLRRDLMTSDIALRVPVVTTSRRAALKSYMEMPEIREELPQRFFLAQQWMSVYRASAEAVEAAPQSFALHRLISRAIADFSIAMADVKPGPALIVPAEELGEVLRLYWDRQPKGRAQHLRAYADARTILWLDLARAEDILRTARRAGIESPKYCDEARELIGFFETNLPSEAEAAKVDSMFPNPGTLEGYIEGRKLDVKFVCTRFRL